MTEKKGSSKWFLYSCFGCLGLAAFFIMIVVGLLGIAFVQVGSEEVHRETITPVFPPQAIPADSIEFAPMAPVAEGVPEQQPPQELLGIPTAGRVILDFQQGEFEIVPGQPGEALAVEASYDKNGYELEEILEAGEDGTWTYRINFHSTGGGGLMASLRQLMGGVKPTVKVVLPVDVPLDLEVRTGQGGLEMDMSGLWLRTADVVIQQGGAALSAPRPLREPMEHLSISTSMGGFAAIKLGNASPRILDLEFSMGGGFFDLRGDWQNDSKISVSASMGGGEVRLPRDVAIEGIELSNARPSSTLELPLPTLRFNVSRSSLENLKFTD